MRFEQLDVWKRACRLSCDVYKELKNCRDYGLRDQMTKAAVSIPSNIADKSAGATFERCDFSIGLEEVRYMDEVHGCTE
ncbi:four helix bundle protein [Shewanella putrefaciens]|nr:four helix bundle protein [Shewanella putrefaciens]